MKKPYKHLSHTEREEIAVLKAEGKSMREIAVALGRNPGTISRELNRNTPPIRMRYSALKAELRAEHRLREPRRIPRLKSPILRRYVQWRIKGGWSPEQIAGRLKQQNAKIGISHEAIYQWIYEDATHLIPFLVRAYKKRQRRGYSRRHGKTHIPDRIPIALRPKSVEERKEPGHWEADTMVHKQGKTAIQAAVERVTRFTKLAKLPRKNAREMRTSLNRRLCHFPPSLLRSITYDNGPENTDHMLVNEVLGTRSYFCAPFHSWEKGTVENTIGVVRRFLPKKTNFAYVHEDKIKYIENWLNSRPMKCLNYRTPAEVMREVVALSG